MNVNNLNIDTNNVVISNSFKRLLYVMVIISFIHSINYFFNTFFAGNFLGKSALVALGICSPLIAFTELTFIFFGKGSGVVCSQYIGKDDTDSVKFNFTLSLFILIIFSAIASILIFIFSDYIAILFGARGNMIGLTSLFIKGYSFSFIPYTLFSTLYNYSILDGGQRINLAIYAIQCVVNFIIDYVMIFIFHWGLFGLGISLAFACIPSILIYCYYFYKSDSFSLISLKGYNKGEMLDEFIKVFKPGVTSSSSRAAALILQLVFNNIILIVGGNTAMAAVAICYNFFTLLDAMFSLGFGTPISLFSAMFYGEESRDSLKELLNISAKEAIKMGTVAMIIVIILSSFLIKCFTKDLNVIAEASLLLSIFALGLIPKAFVTTFTNLYQGTDNFYLSTVLSVLRRLVFVLVVIFALTPFLGVLGLWLSFTLNEILVLAFIVVYSYYKFKKFPKSSYDLIFLGDDFASDIKGSYAVVIDNNINKVMGISENISDFVKDYVEDKRLNYLLSLAIEEMAGNISEHAYDSKDNYIYIKINVKSDNRLICSLYDNGKPFNPIDYSTDEEDPSKNIGIKLIKGLIKDMTYQKSFRLNKLTMWI